MAKNSSLADVTTQSSRADRVASPAQLRQLTDDGCFIPDVLFATATRDGGQVEFHRMRDEDSATAKRSGANVSDEVHMAYPIGYACPGMVNNNHQIPMLPTGQSVC